MSSKTKDLHGRDKANFLVNEIGKHVHVRNAELDPGDDRSFGEFGFHYDATQNVLTGRVYITKADLDLGPAAVNSIRKVTAALDDPKLGGRFEHGGGRFFLDEKRQMLFLVKDFPVEMITSKELWAQMEDLIDLGARWSMKWFYHLALIAHGKEAAPVEPVTRTHDPYPRL